MWRNFSKLLALFVLCGHGFAQIGLPEGVPPDMYRGEFLHASTTIRFCVDTREPEWELHRDIAIAIAEALLLDVDFFEFGFDYAEAARNFQGVPENLLFIFLGDECEAFLGTRMSDISIHPEWVLTSRPYFTSGHVIAGLSQEVLDPAAVLDNPDGPKVGIALGSPMNSSIALNYPDTNRRVYRTEDQLLAGLLNGEVDAGFFYEPRLSALTDGDPASVGLETAVFPQLPWGTWQVGMSLYESRVYIRTMIDEAILALTADGTIDEILAAHGLDDSLITSAAGR